MAAKKTIVVVDDHQDIVTILRTILEGEGFEVQAAYDGVEGLNRIKKTKPDLIVLDIMMPKMDGLEMLSRLKEDANTRSIPVIILTAKHPEEAASGGYDIWADSYMVKPFTSAQLLNVVNRLTGAG